MPNIKGGKAYKKGKHATNESAVFIELEKDQLYGRMIKSLGGLNVMVYCNDDKERICHIRGSMRKKVWINPGDLVIISLREFSNDDKGKERGDVVAKVDQKFYGRLRKDSNTNEKLFTLAGDSSAPVIDQGYVMEEGGEDDHEHEQSPEEHQDQDQDVDQDVDVDNI